MKKETIYKAIAILVIPGAIPVYIGYRVFQLGKKIYDKNKSNKDLEDERTTTENN